jgi:hypothetical protein
MIGAAVWMASFTLYLMTLAPTLTWGANDIGTDGPELLAAADTLGIPHPPGYPTYMLLLKSFATIVPIGDFAYRGNLFSAVMASTAVVFVFALVLRLTTHVATDSSRLLKTSGASIAALMFAATPLLWSHATMTEVYSLNAVFLGALLLVACSIAMNSPDEQDSHNIRFRLALFGFLFGLGLGNHLTLLIVTAPVIAWLAFTLGWRRIASPWLTGAFVLGLAIYLYVPIRAMQNPPINWGNADNFGGILWLVTGRAYSDYFGISPAFLPGRLMAWAHLLFVQFNPLGLFFGIMGARTLFVRQRGLFFATLASILLLTTHSIQFHSIDSQVLMIPVLMLVSIWAGVGFVSVASGIESWLTDLSRLRRFSGIRFATAHMALPLFMIAFLSIPIASVALNYDSMDLSDDTRAYDYASDVLDSVPDGSVVFSLLEGRVFSIWYMRFVEEKHRDVTPIAVPLLQYDWYWENISHRFPERVPQEKPADYTQALRLIVEHNEASSPIFFTYKDALVEESFDVERVGNLFEVRPKSVLAIEEGQSKLFEPAP